MPTILHLRQEGVLLKYEPNLALRQQEERLIYVYPRVVDWMMNVLPDEPSDRHLEISPHEQLGQFLDDFCEGKELCYERQFRPIHHIRDGIWELKTPDVRLFGWFAKKDCMIITAGNTKYKILLSGLVPGYRDEAIRLRNNLDLDQPKFLTGEHPSDVISSYYCPTP